MTRSYLIGIGIASALLDKPAISAAVLAVQTTESVSSVPEESHSVNSWWRVLFGIAIRSVELENIITKSSESL
jgi:hypothetical protein